MESPTSSSEELCHACSKSALLSTPWSQLLQSGEGTPRVLHVWDAPSSSDSCTFCTFIKKEIGWEASRFLLIS